MRKINFLFLRLSIILPILLIGLNSNSIENKIIAMVEDEIITSYELKNKIKTVLFLSNQQLTQEIVNRTKNQAMNSLINYNLKKAEILKQNISSNPKAVQNHLQNISKKYKTDLNGFKNIFKNNNIDYELYLNEIKIEMSWQQLIYKLYSNKIDISEKEIDKELNLFIKNQKKFKEYNLAEIEIFIENNSQDEKKINEIKNQINKIGFENTAIKFSISSSSMQGGKLGWINSKSLSNKISNLLNNMKTGDITKPIYQSNTITFIKILDMRTLDAKDINLNEIKDKIILNKKNDILNLFSNNHLSKIRNNAFIQINE